MIKKTIIATVLLLLVLAGGYYVYKDFLAKEKENKTHLSFLPSNNLVAVVSGEQLFREAHQFFVSSVVWKELSKDSTLSRFETNFSSLDTLLDNNNVVFDRVTFGIYLDENKKLEYKIVADIESENFEKLSEENIISSPNAENNDEKRKVEFTFFNATFNGEFANKKLVASTNQSLMGFNEEDAIINNEKFQKVHLDDEASGIKLYLNFYKTPLISNRVKNILYEVSDGDWAALNFNFGESDLTIEGLLQKENKFTGSSSDVQEHLSFLPDNLEYFSLISGDSLKKQLTHQVIIENDSACNCNFWSDGFYWLDNQIMHFSANFSSSNFLAFRIKDRFSFEEGISYITTIDSNYKSSDSSLNITGITPKIRFASIFNINFEPRFYAFVDDYAILSNDKASLNQLLYNIKAKNTLPTNQGLSDYIQSISNHKAFSRSLIKGFMFNQLIDYDGFSLLEAAQKDKDIVYLTYHYSTAFNIGEKQNEALWQLTFNNPLLNHIYLVNNHRVDEKEVLVQDSANKIYLISNAGEIKWTYQLDGTLMGEPRTVDIYQNGKYQMLLNTSNKIYVLDVLGRDVKGFPVALANMTNAVNVFDYDNNGDYRIFVASKAGIFVFDKLGNEVEGWKQPLTDYDVEQEIRHLRVGGKDYILVNDLGGEIYLYSRQGDIRHVIDKKFTSQYFPVDLGNNILNTRAIYTNNNQLIKHFFDNKKGIVIYANTDSIYSFIYSPYLGSVDKHWYIGEKEKLKVVNKSGVKIKTIDVFSGYKDLSIQNDHLYYINPFNKELVLYDFKLGEDFIFNEAEAYAVDQKFNYDRLILKKGNKLQMVLYKNMP